MHTRLTRVAGLMLGLSLLGGGVAATSAHGGAAAPPAYTGVTAPGTGAGFDAGKLFRSGAQQILAQAQDPACALESADAAEDPNDGDSVQDVNGAGDVAEGDTGADSPEDKAAENAAENANDTDSLQCGDQNESDAAQ